MSKYRITATYTQRVIIEGDGTMAAAEGRVDDLYSGVINEEDGEVSSFSDKHPVVKLEMCLNEEEDLWAVVNK
jgi:hypothetical protein